jgi:hypothetical protein
MYTEYFRDFVPAKTMPNTMAQMQRNSAACSKFRGPSS